MRWGTRHRRTPEDERRAALQREADESLEAWEALLAPVDDITRRREAAEHEAAHAIVGQAFGSTISVAAIGADGSGMCRYSVAGLDDLARATVALAPTVWIDTFRGDRFPRGATGTAQDRRDAIRTGADLQAATRWAFDILHANSDAVLRLADKIDTDGHRFGPSAG